jgi:RNA polymerase sigma-70 factor (sigma-E family)
VKVASERDREFTEFVTARRAALVRVAALLLSGDRARAEDAVQTALTRLYVAWPRVRVATVDAYARRCVVHAAIDDRRSRFRRRERLQSELPEIPVTEHQYVDQTAVVAVLARLAPRMRAAVVLRYIEGLSVGETAAALGCSEGTIKSQCARGLDHLRAAFSQESQNFV